MNPYDLIKDTGFEAISQYNRRGPFHFSTPMEGCMLAPSIAFVKPAHSKPRKCLLKVLFICKELNAETTESGMFLFWKGERDG